MHRLGLVGICVLVLAPTQDRATQAAPSGAVRLVQLSQKTRAHCERSGLLRPVCPHLVPRVAAPYLSNLSVELAGGPVLDVFNLERGGEVPGHPERNRPPRMGHVVAVAGNVERLASFHEPRGARREPVRDGLMRRPRAVPVSFGRVRWGGRVGALYLMPPFPGGGVLGNHLVFSWGRPGRPYALSLHAWEPLTEAAATLERMVESLPGVAETERLRRLSPVRRLVLARGKTTVRAPVAGPAPSIGGFDVLVVVVPSRAEVGLRIVTPAGETLRLLDSTRSRRCRTRLPLRTCLLHVRGPGSVRGGVWTIVVDKRSRAPARVRVDVAFPVVP